MKILALENSAAKGSIAWLGEKGDARSEAFPNDRRHSGAFFAALEGFRDCFAKVELIVVGLGPGSYAGTRIAIGAGIGLQAATGAELGGLPSLATLPDTPNEYYVIGDARRHTFFLAHVVDHRVCGDIELNHENVTRERVVDLRAPLFCSEPVPLFPEAELRFPAATHLAQRAAELPNELMKPPLEPMYLRAPHITIPRGASFS